MVVLDDGGLNGGRTSFSFGSERVGRFLYTPAVVPTRDDDVNRFPQVLTDFAGPQRAVRIKPELPGLSYTVRVNFGADVFQATERIVLGNAVVLACAGMIDVDTQDRAWQIGEILSGLLFIRDAARVAGGNIEHAIRTEPQAAPVVSARRPRQQQLTAGRIGSHFAGGNVIAH